MIDARSGAVYEVLSDYAVHHPRIMPSSIFTNLTVEKGGVGAGTVFHITLRMAGKRQRLHMRVGEPKPGHVLTETNLDTGLVTVFTVSADYENGRTHAQISSEWETAGGVSGLIDRLVAPILMERIFTKQLRQLDQYMHSGEAPV
jgi:hypothetical protein